MAKRKEPKGPVILYVWTNHRYEETHASVVKPTWKPCEDCRNASCPHGMFEAAACIDLCDDGIKALGGVVPLSKVRRFQLVPIVD